MERPERGRAKPVGSEEVARVIAPLVEFVIATFGAVLLEAMRLDDVVGAIPVHLMAGIWGTMAVPLTNSDASFVGQAVGVVAIGAFVFVTSFVLWMVLKVTLGIRLNPDEEDVGGDLSELGHSAYPEFVPEKGKPAE